MAETLQALWHLLQWPTVLYPLAGTALGMLASLLPGINGSLVLTLLIPLTFKMGAFEAITLLAGVVGGGSFAGSIGAILLNVPGEAPNAATALDGYALARQGRAAFALAVSAIASAAGALFGVLVLVALLPITREIVFAFSYPEFLLLAVLGLAVISVAARGTLLKGFIAGCFGMLLSFVGFDAFTGELRYVFDQPYLYDGIRLVPVITGLFGVSEALRLLAEKEERVAAAGVAPFQWRQVLEGILFVFRHVRLLLQSSLIGTVIGIIPGVGGSVASFVAYTTAIQTSADSGKFGRGDARGVLAPEAANDAKNGGAALPTLAFGIPGSSDWAIALGAMVLHGLQPGPLLLREHRDIIWGIIWTLVLASQTTSLVGLLIAPWAVRLTSIRTNVLAPVILALVAVSSYAVEGHLGDVVVAMIFGVVGYYMKKFNVPAVPVILGLLLGALAERSLYQTLLWSGGNPWMVLTRPISLVLMALIALTLGTPFLLLRRGQGTPPPVNQRQRGVASA